MAPVGADRRVLRRCLAGLIEQRRQDLDSLEALTRRQLLIFAQDLASRLQARRGSVLDAVGGQLDSLADLVAAKDEGGVKKILLAIDGVGPRVAATAWMLLSSAED